MDNKVYTYLVECVYEELRTEDVEVDGKLQQRRWVELGVQLYKFTDVNKNTAKQDAKRYFDKVIRYGIKLETGSITSIVMPSSIKRIGLIDYDKFQEEELAKQKAAAQPA